MAGKKIVSKKKKGAFVKSPVLVKETVETFSVEDAPGKHFVGIDYPQVGEILTSDSYALRLSTSATQDVDVSIDGKEWQPCRESVGFWWYDWSGFGAGVHTVVARIRQGKRYLKSKPRSFTAII